MHHAVPYVLIDKAAELTGYTRRAIEAKIAKGQWVEGREWIKAPDGHRVISIAGATAGVEQCIGRKPRLQIVGSVPLQARWRDAVALATTCLSRATSG